MADPVATVNRYSKNYSHLFDGTAAELAAAAAANPKSYPKGSTYVATDDGNLRIVTDDVGTIAVVGTQT